MTRLPGRGPSQRQLRVAEEVRRLMVDILARAHFREPVLAGAAITVTGARVSPDLKNATVYCMTLGGTQIEAVVAALNRSKAYLRGELGHAMKLRYTPDLRFAEDQSFAEADAIEDLLRSERVRRDLAAKDDAEDPG